MAINIKVDRDRMSNLVTVDEYLALLDGDIRTMINILSKFVLGDNDDYLDEVSGRKLIGSLTLEKMKEISEKVISGLEDAAVPPSSGAV